MPPRIYIPVRAKFGIAAFAALCWMPFSVLVSRPWLDSLAAETHWLFALFAIPFIAYVPGFMNTFLTVSLLLDRRPERKQPEAYPGVTVLIAAYQEEAAIVGTLESIARDSYPDPLEVLVLNDGSTDRTADVAADAIERLAFPRDAQVRVVDFEVNRGKSAVSALSRLVELSFRPAEYPRRWRAQSSSATAAKTSSPVPRSGTISTESPR